MIYDDVLDITRSQPDAVRTWDDANTWVAGLTLGGVSDWRLPDTNRVNGTAYNYNYAYTGPLSNVQSYYYWSATEYAPHTNTAWDFLMYYGSQNFNLLSQYVSGDTK